MNHNDNNNNSNNNNNNDSKIHVVGVYVSLEKNWIADSLLFVFVSDATDFSLIVVDLEKKEEYNKDKEKIKTEVPVVVLEDVVIDVGVTDWLCFLLSW